MHTNTIVTNTNNFYQGHNPYDLIAAYGSPLYVYSERIFRQSCRAMASLCQYPNFRVNYAIKANTNLSLLKIAHQEGLCADVSSQGEAVAALAAGYTSKEIMFIVNNVSPEEMQYAISQGFCVSVDSLSQLAAYGRLNPGGNVVVRFNPGMGGGHHEKVITGGDNTKFGISADDIQEVKKVLAEHRLNLIGINHHIGSQNDNDFYLACVQELLDIARQFPDLEIIDFGGGFSIPYNKQHGEKPQDLEQLGEALTQRMYDFAAEYGKNLQFIIEPGRFICAESGVLLGTIHNLKHNGATKYVGCDVGFSVFARPTLYDSHHDIEVYCKNDAKNESGTTTDGIGAVSVSGAVNCGGASASGGANGGASVGSGAYVDTANDIAEVVTIVGNQCEDGDYIVKERLLPRLTEGDVIGILDAGAYGYSMSSQYNLRLRPAEVLICEDGIIRIIRRRDTYDDLLRNMQV